MPSPSKYTDEKNKCITLFCDEYYQGRIPSLDFCETPTELSGYRSLLRTVRSYPDVEPEQ